MGTGSETSPAPVRVGGQALADGVFMRTERAWAVARADGTVEVGEVPANRCPRVPVVRVLIGLVTAIRLGVGKGLLGGRRPGAVTGMATSTRVRRPNRRFLIAMAATELGVGALGWVVQHLPVPHWASTAFQALPWIVVLLALRIAAPATVWRYHGAEHKAVSAHEAGVDLDDVDGVLACARVHDRCGTNLVFLMAVAGLVLQRQPTIVQVPLFALAVAAAAEIVTLAARRPSNLVSRVLLGGGKLLQRHVTTKEPTREEQVIGCRALQAALAEHNRLEAEQAEALAVAA